MFMANSIHSKNYVLRMQGKNEQKVKGAASGLGKVALCCISLPYRHRLSSLLLHFSSTSLRMAWKKQQKVTRAPPSSSKTEMKHPAPGFTLAQCLLLWSAGK